MQTGLTFRWVVSDARDREMRHVFRYWSHYDASCFSIPGEDCANFASQALHARGWAESAACRNTGWDGCTESWVSSTALSQFLAANPAHATRLSDAQRGRVQVGDIVQFQWGDDTDVDHTGIVSRVTREADGHVQVFTAGHTDDTTCRSVDWAITVRHPHSRAFYRHLR